MWARVSACGMAYCMDFLYDDYLDIKDFLLKSKKSAA